MRIGSQVGLIDEHGKLLKERFSAIPAAALLKKPSRVIDTVGVYAILLHDASNLLSLAGYDPTKDGRLWQISGYGHVYTGESVGVCSRLLEHLVGAMEVSTFRESMVALQRGTGAFWNDAAPRYADHTAEQNLSDWLAENALVAFKHCDLVGEVEQDLLRRSPSPLNIKDRPRTAFTDKLSQARAKFGLPKRKEVVPEPKKERMKPYLLH